MIYGPTVPGDSFLLKWMRSVNCGHLMRFGRFKIPRTIELRWIICWQRNLNTKTVFKRKYNWQNDIIIIMAFSTNNAQCSVIRIKNNNDNYNRTQMRMSYCQKHKWVPWLWYQKYTGHGSRMKTIYSDRMRRAEQMNYNRNIVSFKYLLISISMAHRFLLCYGTFDAAVGSIEIRLNSFFVWPQRFPL